MRDQPSNAAERMECHQISVYVAAIALGALFGWLLPESSSALEHAINPVLGALLYVTFLQVPARELLRSLRNARFLAAIMIVNFVVVPIVVAAMFAFLPADQAVRIGVLLVLLCPCVDYVIVFSELAGGSSQRLLSATPLLLIAQMALLPLFLFLFMGSELGNVVAVRPFLQAFLFLIVIPLALAWLTQAWAARSQPGKTVAKSVSVAMVPLMALTLWVVVASQIPKIETEIGTVVSVVPFYIVFLVVMAPAGLVVGSLFRLDVAAKRAVAFSGATRNSLVVLPLALALPSALALAASVVVAQTLIEIIGMIIYVRVIPRLIPEARTTHPT